MSTEPWVPGQPWPGTKKHPMTVAEVGPKNPGMTYCGHRYAEPGCSGCGYTFPDRDRTVDPFEHDPLCVDREGHPHDNECECLCHELTQEQLRRARAKAQARAKTRLVHEFPWRYRELYYLELRRQGLTVVNDHRLGVATKRVLEREREVRDT
jgi:hypothetical protein